MAEPTESRSVRHPAASEGQKKYHVIAAVFPDTKEGKKAFESLEKAGKELKYAVERIPFDKLDFGDAAILDKFYSGTK